MSYCVMLPPLSISSNSIVITWLLINIEPGDVGAGGIYLRGSGPPADHVDLSLTNRLVTLTDESHSEDLASRHLAQAMELVLFTWDEQDLRGHLVDINGNGFIDLDDLECQGLPELRPVPSSTNPPVEFTIAVCHRPIYPEGHRHDEIVACTFTLALHYQPHPSNMVWALPRFASQQNRPEKGRFSCGLGGESIG